MSHCVNIPSKSGEECFIKSNALKATDIFLNSGESIHAILNGSEFLDVVV